MSDLRLKCTKFDFVWDPAPDPADPLAGFKGPNSEGGEGRGREKGRGKEGWGGRGIGPPDFLMSKNATFRGRSNSRRRSDNRRKASMASTVERPAMKPDCSGRRVLSMRGLCVPTARLQRLCRKRRVV